jgi:hypothetical protein
VHTRNAGLVAARKIAMLPLTQVAGWADVALVGMLLLMALAHVIDYGWNTSETLLKHLSARFTPAIAGVAVLVSGTITIGFRISRHPYSRGEQSERNCGIHNA